MLPAFKYGLKGGISTYQGLSSGDNFLVFNVDMTFKLFCLVSKRQDDFCLSENINLILIITLGGGEGSQDLHTC